MAEATGAGQGELDEAALARFAERMRGAGLPEIAIRAFLRALEFVGSGGGTTIAEASIEPAEALPQLDELAAFEDAGRAAVERSVVIKLNGGLGTSMGLSGAKSLLPIRSGLSFLDLIARQVLWQRANWGGSLPLVLMNSYRTRDDSLAALARYPELGSAPGSGSQERIPLDFLQHKVPRIDAETWTPVEWPADDALSWCPPGHGDLYIALASSGMLDRLRAAGIRYAFVSNADNLGADLARNDLAVYRATYGESVDLQVLAGDIENYDNQPAAALEHYEAAASQLWARPIVLRLATAAQAVNSDRAVLVLEQWLSENPDDLQVRRVYGQVLQSRGDRSAAMQQYERVLEQGAEDAVSLNNLAWQYMEEGRPGAVELAERAHELQPDNGSITDTLAWILYRDGQIERAEELLRTAARQSPDNLEIKYHLAAVLAKNGQNSEAESILNNLLAGEQPFASRDKAQELANSL